MNVLIRDLDDETVEALKRRASERNRSLQAELKAIELPMPPEEEQKRIAAIFETLESRACRERALLSKLLLLRRGGPGHVKHFAPGPDKFLRLFMAV